MRYLSSPSRVFLLVTMLTVFAGCASGYSNVREEVDNELLFQQLYVRLVELCDGKSRSEHEACVARINQEAYARYSDRNNPQVSGAQLSQMIKSAVIYGAISVVVTDAIASSIDSSSSSSNSSRSGPKACFTTSTQISYGVNTGGFVAIPVSCN